MILSRGVQSERGDILVTGVPEDLVACMGLAVKLRCSGVFFYSWEAGLAVAVNITHGIDYLSPPFS